MCLNRRRALKRSGSGSGGPFRGNRFVSAAVRRPGERPDGRCGPSLAEALSGTRSRVGAADADQCGRAQITPTTTMATTMMAAIASSATRSAGGRAARRYSTKPRPPTRTEIAGNSRQRGSCRRRKWRTSADKRRGGSLGRLARGHRVLRLRRKRHFRGDRSDGVADNGGHVCELDVARIDELTGRLRPGTAGAGVYRRHRRDGAIAPGRRSLRFRWAGRRPARCVSYR